MHILGQILAGFVIIGAFASAYLTTQVLQVRNEWMKRVETKKSAYEKVAPELPKRRQELFDLERESHRITVTWGKEWPNLTAAQQAGGGLVLTGLDATSGITATQIVHVFQPNPKGGTAYVGPFKVTAIADRAAITPNWITRPSEEALWQGQVGQNTWRVRAQVPISDIENFVRYQNELLLLDIDLVDATKQRDQAVNVDRKYAQDQLDFRISELHGDLGLQDKKGLLPGFLIDGLVKAIEEREEERNVAVQEVDDLRHDLKLVYDEITSLTARNAALMKTLPGGSEPVSVVKAPAIGAK